MLKISDIPFLLLAFAFCSAISGEWIAFMTFILLAVLCGYQHVRLQLAGLRIGAVYSYGKNHQDYIYCWRDEEDSRYYKIGRSNDPFKRMKTFQTAQPKPIRVVSVIAVKDDDYAESYLHRAFAKFRVRNNGEWFHANWWMRMYFKFVRDGDLTRRVQEHISGARA